MSKILIQSLSIVALNSVLPMFAFAQSELVISSKSDVAISQVVTDAVATNEVEHAVEKKKENVDGQSQLEATNQIISQDSQIAAYSVLLDYYKPGTSKDTLGFSLILSNQFQAETKKQTSQKEEPKREPSRSSK